LRCVFIVFVDAVAKCLPPRLLDMKDEEGKSTEASKEEFTVSVPIL
jgi:hypothetical protein